MNCELVKINFFLEGIRIILDPASPQRDQKRRLIGASLSSYCDKAIAALSFGQIRIALELTIF